MNNTPMIKIITYNLRNYSDRWEDRFSLVVRALLKEKADLIAFQEVSLLMGEKNQAELIADALNKASWDGRYHVFLTEARGTQKGREGIAVLSRWPVQSTAHIALPDIWRVAQQVRVDVKGQPLTLFNTHLHHLPTDSERIRYPQAEALLAWTRTCQTPFVVVGDMNARPDSETVALFQASWTAAYEAAHGHEPNRTWPTPMIAALTPGVFPGAIDYIFLSRGDFQVEKSYLIGDAPAPDDPTLYPSDHFGVCAIVSAASEV
jgi:endonuclease/exonuclease/phosphatase family metal-dependent hydrolase